MKTHSNSTMRKARRAARQTAELLTNSRTPTGLLGRAKDQMQHLSEGSVEMVRHNPFKTALAAMAFGFAMGFVMRK